MAQWAVIIPDDRLEAERLFHHERLELTGTPGGDGPSPGDEVLVLAGAAEPAVVALGRVAYPPTQSAAARSRDAARSGDATPAAGDAVRSGGAAPAAGDAARSVEARSSGGAKLTVAYTRRCFDDPQPAGGLALAGPLTPLEPATFRALADRLAPPPDPRTWLVSVDLPIEAATPAEAVRRFWSYVMELGPRELPAFVSPSDDELAMQAFVLGEHANLDPEEDDDEQ